MWTTKYERLLKVSFVWHVETKSVFTSQPISCLVSSLLPRFEHSFYGSETDNYVDWRRWYTLLRKKDESRLRKRKVASIFEEICPPVTINHTRTSAEKGKYHSFYGIFVSTPHWLIQLTKNSFTFSFYTLSVYSKAT